MLHLNVLKEVIKRSFDLRLRHWSKPFLGPRFWTKDDKKYNRADSNKYVETYQIFFNIEYPDILCLLRVHAGTSFL